MDTINVISYWYNLIETFLEIGIFWIFENFREFAWIVRVAAISLTVSIGLILISFIKILTNAWRKHRWKKVEKKLADRYGEGIAAILSRDAKPNMGREEELKILELENQNTDRRTLLKDWRERMVIARLIYRSRIDEDAKLENDRNLHVLLNIFGTKEFLEEVIIKDKMHLKVEALHMLRAFKTPTNQWIANQLINSKRKRVQRLAMYASIMSSANTDLEYFESDFFDENFCLYDEIQLGFVLARRQSVNRKIPNLAHWALIQKNAATQAVFVRLMRQFNQGEYCAELEELFQHNTEGELIEEIARTWGYLKYKEGEHLLKDMLMTQPDTGKIAIMHALARLNSGESLGMLLDVYRNTGSQYVKFEALRCIYAYGEEGKAKFHELQMNATPAERNLFAFFSNDLTARDIPLEKTARYHSEYGENLYSVL